MKILKTLTVAVIAVVALAFCATNAGAVILPVTTNYDTVTFSATIMTNGDLAAEEDSSAISFKSRKLVTKDLLKILENSDFAGASFPAGSKLVVGWDRNGDVLVINKTGSILFDATSNNGNSNIATVVVSPYTQRGALTARPNGGLAFTWYNNGTFLLMDQNTGINIPGAGPCTERFSAKNVALNTVWTDLQTFSMYGSSVFNAGNPYPGTLTGKITLSGKGDGEPEYILDELFGFIGL